MMNVNITNLRRGKVRPQFTIASCLLPLACILLFATVCFSAPFETTYDWEAVGTDGWTNGYAGVTLSNPSGNLEMSFRSQTVIPQSETDFMGVQVADGQVITHLQFDFNCVNGHPSAVWVAIHSSESGNMWRHPVEIGAVGDYIANDIDVVYGGLWSAGSQTSPEQFDADMKTTDWVGVFVRRGGSIDAQMYRLDDFRIAGYTGDTPPPPVDSDGDGMTDAWEIDNDLDPNDPGDAILDSDGDGMSNFAEYLTGTNPNDPNSSFGVEIGSSNKIDSVKGFMIQWNSQSGRKYDVLRSGDLSAGFDVLEENVTNTPPKSVYYDGTSTNGESFFYKIRVRE